MECPGEFLSVAESVALRLGKIERVVAVALGGSCARGTAGKGSDVDLGIYYWPSKPPSVELFRRLACDLHDDSSPPEVTDFGEWGPWVNGGAWLRIHGLKVDWLYRDLERVSKVVADCYRGVATCDYYLGHPTDSTTTFISRRLTTVAPFMIPPRFFASSRNRSASPEAP